MNESKVRQLFEGWEETMIYACLDHTMGKIIVDNEENPQSALASVGCFVFLAGEPNCSLLENIDNSFSVLVQRDEHWGDLIEDYYKDCHKVVRYATKKDTQFDIQLLESYVSSLSKDYCIKRIDSSLYDQCLHHPFSYDLVASFESKEAFLNKGIGMVVLKGQEIVAGASSFSRYEEGIEIEVDTLVDYRRQHLALCVSAALILECINKGLYPSWDAQNKASLALSLKLGYEFSHEYIAYEINY